MHAHRSWSPHSLLLRSFGELTAWLLRWTSFPHTETYLYRSAGCMLHQGHRGGPPLQSGSDGLARWLRANRLMGDYPPVATPTTTVVIETTMPPPLHPFRSVIISAGEEKSASWITTSFSNMTEEPMAAPLWPREHVLRVTLFLKLCIVCCFLSIAVHALAADAAAAVVIAKEPACEWWLPNSVTQGVPIVIKALPWCQLCCRRSAF